MCLQRIEQVGAALVARMAAQPPSLLPPQVFLSRLHRPNAFPSWQIPGVLPWFSGLLRPSSPLSS